jgi:tetratricopeptide (TPR) repeat protein
VLLSAKNREVAGQRNAALAAADEAEAVNAFLDQDLLGQADPDVNSREQKVTVEQVLAKAAAKIDGNARFADKPAVEATLRLTIGKTYFKLGDHPEAEKHLRRAVELRQAALGPDDPKTLAAQDAFADFLNRGPERFTESEPLAQQTWEAFQRVLGANDRATLNALDTYASAVHGSGRADEALALHRKCLDGRRRALGPEDPDTLQSMNNLGLMLSYRGEWGESLGLLRQAVAGREKRPIESESFAPAGNLALALYHLGDLKEADELLGRYVPQASKLLTPTHTYTQHLKAFRARVWLDQGRAEEALPELRAVVESRRQVFKDGSWRIGSGLVDLGRALLAVGKVIDAEKALAEARSIYRKFPPANDYYSAWADACHGAALAALGRYPKAEELLLAAEPRLAALKTCPRRHYRQVLEHLVRLYDAVKKPEAAARWRLQLGEQTGPK